MSRARGTDGSDETRVGPDEMRVGADEMRVGADVLVVSNGHGEDAIGAALVRRLRTVMPDLVVRAFPLVGEGSAYDADVVVGPRRSLPAGGLTLHHTSLLLQDLRAGIIGLTVRQAVFLRGYLPRAVLVVGDAYAQLLASLVRAPRAVLQPLVSVEQERPFDPGRLNRYFMESIRAPERYLLSRAQRVYARDAATALALRDRGVPAATYLGNPIMDGLIAEPLVGGEEREGRVVVALLPGSRGYAQDSVRLMLDALLAAQRHVAGGVLITGLVAWTRGESPAVPSGWRKSEARPRTSGTGRVLEEWTNQRVRVWWVQGGFASVLAAADAVIGTAGTANEQAAGLGLPVVAFPVPPSYGRAFLDNQARLLGGALRVAEPRPADVALTLAGALAPGPHRQAAATVGPARLGEPGGTDAIASDLQAWLGDLA